MDGLFSTRLSDLRRERRLNQTEVAQTLKISQALLSQYETGAREPSVAFLLRVCDFYEVSCDYMLGRTSVREVLDMDPEEYFEQSGCLDEAEWPERHRAGSYRNMVVQSVDILFDLLGKMGEKDAIVAAYRYLGTGVYRLFRLLSRFAPDGKGSLFAVEDLEYIFGASRAELEITELEYYRALKRRKDEGKRFPSTGYKALRGVYPDRYHALFQIIYSGGQRTLHMLEGYRGTYEKNQAKQAEQNEDSPAETKTDKEKHRK